MEVGGILYILYWGGLGERCLDRAISPQYNLTCATFLMPVLPLETILPAGGLFCHYWS